MVQYVMVACPLGKFGMGGIDRLMDEVRSELSRSNPEDLVVEFRATRGQGSIWLSPFFLSAFLSRMVLARLGGRLDLVHINVAHKGSTYRKSIIAFVARRIGVATVVHLHGAEFHQVWKMTTPSSRRLLSHLFLSASKIIVLGNFWRKFIEEAMPATAERIVLLPNATRRFLNRKPKSDSTKVRILFLGQLGERKGVPILLRALAQLSDLSNWTVTLAGDGEVDHARREVVRLGLQGRVEIPGWVSPEIVTEYLSTADVLVLPSLYENLPMSIIEGMSAGVAIVATPVGAVEDIITDGVTGLLVEPGNISALATALRSVIVDFKLRHRLGEAGHKFHQDNLEIEPYVKKLRTIWKDAISLHRASA